MVHALKIIFIGAVCVASARADLQLTPKRLEYQADGVKSEILAFSGETKTVTYEPPRGWNFSGDATKLVLHPPKSPQAEASVTKLALKSAAVFDDDTTKALVTEALRSAPAGSTDVALTSQEKSPFYIAGKETFVVSFTYNLFGVTYTRSLVFLNRATDQIRFQLVARTSDFNGLQGEFQRSLCTWRNL